MRLLGQREHSAMELERKLGMRGIEAQAIRAVLADLGTDGLQSDTRYAESFVRGRISRGKGPVRIRVELDQRGVDAVLIEEALREADADWTGLARSARRKRFGDSPADYAERARQARFLSSRGFSAEQVRGALERD